MSSRLKYLALVAILIIGACSPKVLTQVRTEYKTVTDYQHDTLWRDKEKVIKEKGDTITIIEKEYIYKTLWKSKTDTCYVHDTTAVERIKEVKVEKPLSWTKRLKIGAFWWLLIAVAVGFRKEIFKLIKLFL